MDAIFKAIHKTGRVSKPDIETVYGHGFVATLNHDEKLVTVQFYTISHQACEAASKFVEKMVAKGYDNVN
jgi:hypothetical protein